jgi:hypothetical protein
MVEGADCFIAGTILTPALGALLTDGEFNLAAQNGKREGH